MPAQKKTTEDRDSDSVLETGSTRSPNEKQGEDIEESTQPGSRGRTRNVILDSSDDEDGTTSRKKAKMTHKPTKQAVRANPNGPKRFSWTSGSGISASRYLETRYLEWEAGDSRKREDVIDSVSQYLLATYDITRNAGDLKHSIFNRFKNLQQLIRKGERQLPTEGGADASSTTEQPARGGKLDRIADAFMKSLKARTPAASTMWARENDEVVRVRTEGMDIGSRQRTISELFSALSEGERAAWRDKAHALKDDVAQDPNACFENQSLLTPLLAKVLSQFPGHEANQFGQVIMHLRIGMRDMQGMIIREQMTIGVPDGAPAYSTYQGGPDVREQERWEEYLRSTLPSNPVRGDPRLLMAEDGTPSLPPADKAWNGDDMASILSAYFRVKWNKAGRAVVEGGVPWDDVKAEPHVYLNGHWASTDVIADPTEVGLIQLCLMYDTVHKAQSSDGPFAFRTELDGQGLATSSKLSSASSEAGDHASETVAGTPRRGTRRVQVFPTPTRATPSTRHSSAAPSHATPLRTLFSTQPPLPPLAEHSEATMPHLEAALIEREESPSTGSSVHEELVTTMSQCEEREEGHLDRSPALDHNASPGRNPTNASPDCNASPEGNAVLDRNAMLNCSPANTSPDCNPAPDRNASPDRDPANAVLDCNLANTSPDCNPSPEGNPALDRNTVLDCSPANASPDCNSALDYKTSPEGNPAPGCNPVSDCNPMPDRNAHLGQGSLDGVGPEQAESMAPDQQVALAVDTISAEAKDGSGELRGDDRGQAKATKDLVTANAEDGPETDSARGEEARKNGGEDDALTGKASKGKRCGPQRKKDAALQQSAGEVGLMDSSKPQVDNQSKRKLNETAGSDRPNKRPSQGTRNEVPVSSRSTRLSSGSLPRTKYSR